MLHPGEPTFARSPFTPVRSLAHVSRVYVARRTGCYLLILHPRVSTRLDCQTMLSRVNEVQNVLNDQREAQKDTVNFLEAQLERNREQNRDQLDSIQANVDQQKGCLQRLLFCANKGADTTQSLQQVLNQVLRLTLSLHGLVYQALYFIRPTRGQPITLEDALGNVREIPLDWIGSWEVGPIFVTDDYRH